MQSIKILRTAFLILMLANLAGCGSGPVAPPGSTTPNAAAPSVAAPVTPPPALTEAEMKDAESFAKKLETSINAGDPEFFKSHMDYAAIQQAASKDLELSRDSQQGFISGVKKSDLATKIIESMKSGGGKYKFLRVRQVNGVAHALFRLNVKATNYHEFYLKPTGGDQSITDIFIYLSGEPLTTTFRRGLLQVAAEENKGILDRLTGTENEYVKYVGELGEIRSLQAQGKLQEALDRYAALPPGVQHDKTVMFLRLGIVQGLSRKLKDNAAYRATLDDFQKYFPNDPTMDFVLIDSHFLNKDFSKALTCIDRVNQSLGGDANMVFLRANVYHEMKDIEKMKESAKEAVAMEPDFPRPYYLLIEASLDEKNYAETVTQLNALQEHTKMTYPKMEQMELFADFIKSKEYREWRLSRKANQSETKQHN